MFLLVRRYTDHRTDPHGADGDDGDGGDDGQQQGQGLTDGRIDIVDGMAQPDLWADPTTTDPTGTNTTPTGDAP